MSGQTSKWRRLSALDGIAQGTSHFELPEGRVLVSRRGDDLRAFSPVCPHQGGSVQACPNGYRCPLHDWSFDHDGYARNVTDVKLSSLPHEVRDDALWVQPTVTRIEHESSGDRLLPGVDVHLHSHACVSLHLGDLHVLTDPWLDGSAFMGAWMPYPINKVDIDALEPDVIAITHEHSDHFHLPTLMRLPRETMIAFPAFPNGRIEAALIERGFTNLHPVRLGGSLALSSDVALSFFEASALWNDAILLLESSRARVLDLNDAGLNHRIIDRIGAVDLLLCQFNAGASGFPATWAQVSEDDKRRFYRDALATKQELLRQAVTQYRARLLLPFASFFTLWEPEHAAFMDMLEFHRPWALREAIEGEGLAGVLDLLPGDAWHGASGAFERLRTPEAARRLYDKQTMLRASHVRRRRFEATPEHQTGQGYGPAASDDVVAYFERLNRTPASVHCEDIRVQLRELDGPQRCFGLDVVDHAISVRLGPRDDWQLEMAVPASKLALLIANDLSWDELHIGYWARFDRRPNVFHPGFWRMLQAPYYLRDAPVFTGARAALHGDVPVEAVLRDVPGADAILRSHGLYCSGCGEHAQETLAVAAACHGLDSAGFDALLRELNFVSTALAADERGRRASSSANESLEAPERMGSG